MEGYDRPPFSSLQLESFNRQVTQRLDQEKKTANQVMVRNVPFNFLKTKNVTALLLFLLYIFVHTRDTIIVFIVIIVMPDISPIVLFTQADLQEKDQQKQQSIDEMRDKKTGLERTVELKRDMQGKKQQEMRNVRTELLKLEGSSSRLQELENELAKVVGTQTIHSCCFLTIYSSLLP